MRPGYCGPDTQPRAATIPRRLQACLDWKKVTGPGPSPAIWKYSYQSNIGFRRWPTGTGQNPRSDGALDTYTFGNTYGVDEGLLLSHTRANGTQAPLMSEVHTATGAGAGLS